MRPYRLLSVLAAAAGLLALSGCRTPKPALPKPIAATTIKLAPDNRDVPKSIKINETLTVVLPPPIDPGDAWEIVANNTKLLPQISALKTDSKGGATATFMAVHFGRSLLRFVALKPGQTVSAPTDLYQIIVTANTD